MTPPPCSRLSPVNRSIYSYFGELEYFRLLVVRTLSSGTVLRITLYECWSLQRSVHVSFLNKKGKLQQVLITGNASRIQPTRL